MTESAPDPDKATEKPSFLSPLVSQVLVFCRKRFALHEGLTCITPLHATLALLAQPEVRAHVEKRGWNPEKLEGVLEALCSIDEKEMDYTPDHDPVLCKIRRWPGGKLDRVRREEIPHVEFEEDLLEWLINYTGAHAVLDRKLTLGKLFDALLEENCHELYELLGELAKEKKRPEKQEKQTARQEESEASHEKSTQPPAPAETAEVQRISCFNEKETHLL